MKRLLNEDTTRKFMKLANLKPHTENFLEKVEEACAGHGPGKEVKPGANKATGRWLKEEEEVSEDAEVTEEGFLSEQDPEEELPPEEEPAGEELPPEEPVDEPEMEPGQEDLDVTSIVQAVTDALAQELEAQGHPVDIDVAGDGEAEPLGEPEGELGDEEPLGEPEGELGDEEDPVLEDFDAAGISVEEDLDEEYLNEVTRRVAKRLLSVSKR